MGVANMPTFSSATESQVSVAMSLIKRVAYFKYSTVGSAGISLVERCTSRHAAAVESCRWKRYGRERRRPVNVARSGELAVTQRSFIWRCRIETADASENAKDMSAQNY
jgi:hypothetical protein